MSDRLALELEPVDTLRLANLCGQFDEHLKQVESRLGVEIFCRGNLFTFQGSDRTCRAASRLLQRLYRLSATEVLTPEVINLHLQESGIDELGDEEGQPGADDEVSVKTKRGYHPRPRSKPEKLSEEHHASRHQFWRWPGRNR